MNQYEERLHALRTRIDEIDSELVPLLAERMAISERVAGIKGEANLPVLDEIRETQVIERAATLAGEAFGGDVSELMRAVLTLSRKRQQKVLNRDKQGDFQP